MQQPPGAQTAIPCHLLRGPEAPLCASTGVTGRSVGADEGPGPRGLLGVSMVKLLGVLIKL